MLRTSVQVHSLLDGYSMMRTEAPKARGGMLDANLLLTTPLLPCTRVTRPQMTRTLLPRTSFCAR